MEQSRINKMLKVEVNDDRISALPDSLIQHILSFLPSTKQAIQTGILSKRWQNQWTRVPVLIFDYGMYSVDFDSESFARFIDSAFLQYDCSNIRKLQLGYEFQKDTNFSLKIRFAMTRHMEELILNCYVSGAGGGYLLPKFLFYNISLVKLKMLNCYFLDDWSINWRSLKAFKMDGCTSKSLVANVLYGSPSLESLELNHHGASEFFIASKSLKILILDEADITHGTLTISCPNLEEFTLILIRFSYCSSLDKLIENVLSESLFLRSLYVEKCYFVKLVLASKSLRKLVLRRMRLSAIEISCPNLEELDLYGPSYATFKLMNTPSLICANLDFELYRCQRGCPKDISKQFFEQLQNVEKLTVRDWFVETLSKVEMEGLSYQWSKNKTLTLNGPNFEHLPGIMYALRSSPALERLVITLKVYKGGVTSDAFGENYWNSNGTDVDCLLSQLKSVEIVGLSQQDAKCKSVLNFIGFLLKNAKVLEKLVLVISKYGGVGFAFEVSQRVSSFPRYSRRAVVELLCSDK